MNLEAVKEKYQIVNVHSGYLVAVRKSDNKKVRLDFKHDDRGYSNFKEA